LELTESGSASVRARDLAREDHWAAGGPPMTDANEDSTAATSMFSLRVPENTTNAPPW